MPALYVCRIIIIPGLHFSTTVGNDKADDEIAAELLVWLRVRQKMESLPDIDTSSVSSQHCFGSLLVVD